MLWGGCLQCSDAADEDCVAYVYQVGRDGTLRKPYSLKCPPTPDLVEHVQWRFGAGESKLSSFAGAAPWSVPPSLRWQARSRDHRLRQAGISDTFDRPLRIATTEGHQWLRSTSFQTSMAAAMRPFKSWESRRSGSERDAAANRPLLHREHPLLAIKPL